MHLAGLPVQQHLVDHPVGQVTQLPVPRRPLYAEEAVAFDVIAVKQLLAAHVLVTGGDIALGQAEFMGPARHGVFIKADEDLAPPDQVPGLRAATEAIDLMPEHMPPPGPDQVTRGAALAPREHSEA